MVNFGEVRRGQLAKSIPAPPRWCPWDLFRSFKVFQMLKREWGAESTGKLPHLLIPGKTASLIPEFAVEELQPWYVSGQWFLFKKLSTESPVQAPEVCKRNFRTPCIFVDLCVVPRPTKTLSTTHQWVATHSLGTLKV